MDAETSPITEVLVVDDDKPTAALVSKVLSRSGRTSRQAHSAASAIESLSLQRFEMVLLDYLLGTDDCWSVLNAAKKRNPPVPVVVVTGSGSERIAVEALRRGAVDYVIKNGDYWQQLPEIVTRTLAESASARLRDSQAAAVASTDDGIIGNTASGIVTSWNPGAQTIYGYSAAEMIGTSVFHLFATNHRAEVKHSFEQLARGKHVGNFNTIGITKAQNPVRLSIGFSPMLDDQNKLGHVTILARDITDPMWACSMQGLAILSNGEGVEEMIYR